MPFFFHCRGRECGVPEKVRDFLGCFWLPAGSPKKPAFWGALQCCWNKLLKLLIYIVPLPRAMLARFHGVPASYVSEWGERRHKSPQCCVQHSLRSCCRTRWTRYEPVEAEGITTQLCCSQRSLCEPKAIFEVLWYFDKKMPNLLVYWKKMHIFAKKINRTWKKWAEMSI